MPTSWVQQQLKAFNSQDVSCYFYKQKLLNKCHLSLHCSHISVPRLFKRLWQQVGWMHSWDLLGEQNKSNSRKTVLVDIFGWKTKSLWKKIAQPVFLWELNAKFITSKPDSWEKKPKINNQSTDLSFSAPNWSVFSWIKKSQKKVLI